MTHDGTTEVQVSIDRISITRDGDAVTVEAKDVVMTATGPDGYAAGSAVSSQLEALLSPDRRPDLEDDAAEETTTAPEQ